MREQMNIDDFVEQVVAIKPGGFPGFSGGSTSGILGASNTQSDMTLQLQRAAIAFSKSYVAKSEDLSAKADALGGLIMTEAVVGAISQSQADTLIDTLHRLTEERD